MYQVHTENAAKELIKRFMGPFAFLFVSAWDLLLTRTFGIRIPVTRNAVAEKRPVYYTGNHLAMYPHGYQVPMPSFSDKVLGFNTYLDYEMELAVILGKSGRNLSAEEAQKHIAAFVLFNDFSVRNQQIEDCVVSRFGMQKSKSFANTMASTLVTADEIEQLGGFQKLRGEVLVNGKLTSVGSAKGPLYSPAELIAYLSMNETLYPGEMIGLGTLPRCAGIELGVQLRTGDTISF
jgi:2-keto-4-pentenoate hydratase/2-oxohepta-3-ene-1,7-dioic acid hydratase in catechol pathway